MEITDKKIIFEGRYLRLVEKNVVNRRGENFFWETIERKNVYGWGGVVIIALTKDRELILENNWRAPIESSVIQFPAGLTDIPGENEEQAARTVPKLLMYYRQPVMVEEFIDGEEVTVGITGNSPPGVLGMMRILPRKNEGPFVYSLEVKRDWKTLVDYECPARLEAKLLSKISAASLNVFKALECRDFARVDFRVDKNNEPWVLEINANPCLSPDAGFAAAALQSGLDFKQVVGRIVYDRVRFDKVSH